MAQAWRALVAFLTLVAFFLANSSGVVHTIAASRCPLASSAATVSECASPLPASTCKCCCCKRADRATCSAPTSWAERQASPDQAPCPSGTDCPCPGGCPYCSVAKVLCCTPLAPAPVFSPCLVHDLPETALLFPPPPCGKLIRPPRA